MRPRHARRPTMRSRRSPCGLRSTCPVLALDFNRLTPYRTQSGSIFKEPQIFSNEKREHSSVLAIQRSASQECRRRSASREVKPPWKVTRASSKTASIKRFSGLSVASGEACSPGKKVVNSFVMLQYPRDARMASQRGLTRTVGLGAVNF